MSNYTVIRFNDHLAHYGVISSPKKVKGKVQ